MKAPSPSNATCLAAEFMAAAIPRLRPLPYQAAVLATDLCALGRRYKRLSERLCGGEEEWGRYPEAGDRMARAERARGKLRERIEKLVEGSPFKAHVEGESLILSVVTRRGLAKDVEERTALL
jgi:hypothetical protein